MMKTKRKDRGKPKPRTGDQRNRDAILLMISVGFLCGAVLGGVTEGRLPADEYVTEFLATHLQGQETPGLWRELWITFRWPGAVVLLSLLPVAGLTVPLAFFIRGFLLAYGITAVAVGSGLQGMLWAGLLFGPTSLLTIPVMFALAVECLMLKAVPNKEPQKLPIRLLWCIPALVLCVFLNQAVVPPVLHFFLEAFQTGA